MRKDTDVCFAMSHYDTLCGGKTYENNWADMRHMLTEGDYYREITCPDCLSHKDWPFYEMQIAL